MIVELYQTVLMYHFSRNDEMETLRRLVLRINNLQIALSLTEEIASCLAMMGLEKLPYFFSKCPIYFFKID